MKLIPGQVYKFVDTEGRVYTGPVYEDSDGDILFANAVVQWANGDPCHVILRLLELPTEPLSLIKNVTLKNNSVTFALGVQNGAGWVLYEEDGDSMWVPAGDIKEWESFV